MVHQIELKFACSLSLLFTRNWVPAQKTFLSTHSHLGLIRLRSCFFKDCGNVKIYGQNSQPWHNRWRFYSQQFIKTLLKKSREKHIIHSASVFRRIKNVSLLLCTHHRILLSLKVTFFLQNLWHLYFIITKKLT